MAAAKKKYFHNETFSRLRRRQFVCARAEELCKALSREKLADSNLEKLYLAGFLRHGFLIKCAFTFPRPLLSTAAFDSLRFLDECFFVAFFCLRQTD